MGRNLASSLLSSVSSDLYRPVLDSSTFSTDQTLTHCSALEHVAKKSASPLRTILFTHLVCSLELRIKVPLGFHLPATLLNEIRLEQTDLLTVSLNSWHFFLLLIWSWSKHFILSTYFSSS
ncbi:hypothetical protein BpHYR1_029375 [Brachionus plicatilis]|uniref:Uncharacterized protein n=1 Tax=Brachionus plicatilis TaxID=10195 RepID=A0A3M7PBE6_BRAPC|nr:hypothetical protein BpHYR1_029375 [Brachionus plicatilis]